MSFQGADLKLGGKINLYKFSLIIAAWLPLAVTSTETGTAAVAYPLLLAGHKSLKAWRHSESQLIDERRLVLSMDLHFDAGFKRRLICKGKRTDSVTIYGGLLYMAE